MLLVAAHASRHLPAVRALFTEYAASLNLDLCFQNFAQELTDLPGRYAPPEGRLWLVFNKEQAVGCVALRKFSPDICEMKRLYVQPGFRAHGLGRKLAEAAILAAREIGYAHMRLDTLDDMTAAIALYESLGFRRIGAYYANPSPRAVFMELQLD